MSETCKKCNLQLGEYAGDDIESIFIKKLADGTIIENEKQIVLPKEEVKEA